jgi:predicted RNA-binding protein with PIN domain
MPYLVDGYNLAGISKRFSGRTSHAADEVVRFLNRFARLKKSRVTVVFDGFPPDWKPSQPLSRAFDAVRIIFTGSESDADTKIRGMIAAAADRRGWIVISTDHAVYNYARVHGLRALRSNEFINEVNALLEQHAKSSGEVNEKVSSNEVEYWLEVFGGKE